MRISVIKEAVAIIILAAVSAILFNSFAANGLDIIYSPPHVQPGSTLDLDELNSFLERQTVVLIDARSKEAFSEGHIPGAQNLPLQSSRNYKVDFLSSFPKETIFILYCINSECTQAERLERQFNLLGFANTYVFTGGWEAWQRAGRHAQ